LVVPLVLVGFYNLWSARQFSRQQLDISVARQAEFAATAFEQWLEAQTQTLFTIKHLSEYNQSPLTLKDYLNSIVKTRPHWLDVQIVGAAGEVKLSQSAKDRPLPLVSIETIRQEISAKNELVILTEQFDEEKLRLLSLALPIAGGDFVVARIDGASASSVFEQLELPENHIIAVFDSSNRLLYRNRVSPEQMSLDVGNTPLLSALDEKSIAAIEVESPYDKIQRVYGLARVATGNSIVAVGVPSAILYETARRQFLNQLFFGLLITALAALAALLIARSIIAPMRVLMNAAREFGAGNLKTRAEITQSSVVRELGETFNQMAEQIAEREEKLKELDRLKSEFVSSVSHELRTPLTTIKSLAHVLQRGNITATEQKEFLETIAFECDRQIDFVQNLLDLSRIESGAFPVRLVETDVAHVLQICAESQKQATAARGLKLKFIEPDENGLNAVTDSGVLQRIVTSLLENAMKYTPEDGEITLSAKRKKDRIEIQITDTGCGIAGEDLPHIFEKFYRGKPLYSNDRSAANSETRQTVFNEFAGVGLGLYMVKNLAEQIGAQIAVESPANENECGAKFTLILPL
jgi:signal transduction histidine kinase